MKWQKWCPPEWKVRGPRVLGLLPVGVCAQNRGNRELLLQTPVPLSVEEGARTSHRLTSSSNGLERCLRTTGPGANRFGVLWIHNAEQLCDFSSPSVNGTEYGTCSSSWVVLWTERTLRSACERLAAVSCAALGMVTRGCHH